MLVGLEQGDWYSDVPHRSLHYTPTHPVVIIASYHHILYLPSITFLFPYPPPPPLFSNPLVTRTTPTATASHHPSSPSPLFSYPPSPPPSFPLPPSDAYHPYRHGLGKWVRKYEYARALWPNGRAKTRSGTPGDTPSGTPSNTHSNAPGHVSTGLGSGSGLETGLGTHKDKGSPPVASFPPLSCALKAVFGDRTGAFIGLDFVGDDFDILTCAAVTNVQVHLLLFHQPCQLLLLLFLYL